MTITGMLVVIAFLLLILIWQSYEGLSRLHSAVERIQRAAKRWEDSQREGSWLPDPEPTKEEKQKKDEFEQERLRQRAEHEGGGWKPGRIVCRRTPEVFEYEYVLSTADRAYTARGRLECFCRDGKDHVAQTLQLDTTVRFAVPEAQGKGLGLLLVENPEGRILSLQLTEEKLDSLLSTSEQEH